MPEKNPGLGIVGCDLIQGRSATESPVVLSPVLAEERVRWTKSLEPHHLMVIYMTFDDVCKALKLAGNHNKAGR